MWDVLGLFSGFGGLELGLTWAGMNVRWLAEKDAYRRAALEQNFPDARVFGDVRDVTGETVREPVDVVAAGFPCTNVSRAGDRTGLDGPESGLWSEVARVVRELSPRYVFVENVAALLDAGRGFDRVLGDLAACGFDAEWDCLPAAAFGAPHLRDRLWLVAYPDDAGRSQPRRPEPAPAELQAAQHGRPVHADAAGVPRRQGDRGPGLREGRPRRGRRRPDHVPRPAGAEAAEATGELAAALPRWRDALPGLQSATRHGLPPEPLLRGVDDGIPGWVDRVDGLGDSALPQTAEWIGRRLIAYDAATGA